MVFLVNGLIPPEGRLQMLPIAETIRVFFIVRIRRTRTTKAIGYLVSPTPLKGPAGKSYPIRTLPFYEGM
jgi:hypothetical protein